MKVTLALKDWAIANLSLPKDATDEMVKKSLGEAVGSGKLTIEKLTELSKEEPAKKDAGALLKSLIGEAVAPLTERMDKLEKAGVGAAPAAGAAPASGAATATKEEPVGDKSITSIMEGITAAAVKGVQSAMGRQAMHGSESSGIPEDVTPVKLFGMENDNTPANEMRVRVKSVTEWYDTTTKGAYYPENTKHTGFAGRRVKSGDGGRDLDLPSQLDKAVSGAFFKYSVGASLRAQGQPIPPAYKMTDHDNALMLHAAHNMKWTGLLGYNEDQDESKHKLHDTKLNQMQIKALLDDTISGGLEAAPIVFDDNLIITPLLNGEIFPKVTLVNIARGRRIEGFSMGNPTITDGYPEGTEVPLFDTSGFIAAFDTTIFDAVGSIEIGANFEEDSPVAIADRIMERYGQQYLTYLDKVCVLGNGVTQPEGIFNASGTVGVNASNTSAGPPVLSDYEALLFGVTKEYRPKSDSGRMSFVSNEVTYRRSRAMKVNPATPSTDERRLLGMDHESYKTLEYDHAIHHGIGNRALAFVNWRYYRMYRRLGLQVRVESGGRELVRRNQRMIVVRARFGGQLELGGACAVQADGQS